MNASKENASQHPAIKELKSPDLVTLIAIASLGRAAFSHAQAAHAARFSTTADRHWEEFDAAVKDLLAAMAEADGRGPFGRIETLLVGVRT